MEWLLRRGGGRLLNWTTVMTVVAFPGTGFSHPGEAGGEHHEVAAAEEKLAHGDPEGAVALYQAAFTGAPSFEERLGLIGPLARAAVVNQEVDALLGELASTREDRAEAWEPAVFQAAVFQFLQDLPASAEALSVVNDLELPGHLTELFRRQQQVWAEETGDAAAMLRLSREAFGDDPSDENQLAYVRALLEAGTGEELLGHLKARAKELSAEVEFWRSLLPELQQHDAFESVASILEEGWEQGKADAEVLFALAELRVFEGRLDEATELFWAVFETNELARPTDGRPYFQRLNHFFHNRFAVKNRLGQATGRYGTRGCRQYFFLGLREDVEISDVGSARDAALLYLRELLVPEGSSVAFLQRLLVGLDWETRPPAQRILAFAGIGAPAWMLEEVETFVESVEADGAAAEFSLLAINRFVLSTDKFPELRSRMGNLARALESKFQAGRPPEARRRSEEMEARILSRLGFDAGNESEAEEGSREEVFARMAEAAAEGEPAEAERIYRDFVDRTGAEEEGNILLFLARTWQAKNNPEQAAVLVAEFLEPLYRGGPGTAVPGPVEWSASGPFPPPNPYFGELQMEALQSAFETVGNTPVWDALKNELSARDGTLPRESRAGAIAARVVLHWWAEEPDEAIAVAGSGYEDLADPELGFLLVHLLGGQEQFEEGRKVLEEMASATPGNGDGDERLRRLLFAFAVAGRDSEEPGARAKDLEELPLVAGEKLQIAFGLGFLGLEQQAVDWLEEVEFGELDSRQTEDYQRLQLRVLATSEDPTGATALARSVLLGGLPSDFHSLMTVLRLEALEILAGAGEMEEYQRQLRELIDLAPDSPSLHLLLGESADFRWEEASGGSEEEAVGFKEEAIRSYSRAVALRPEFVDFRLELCEWLGRRELWEEAVVHYRQVLEMDALAALLDTKTLFEPFRRAGRLPLLVEFLEEWQAPEATSMDDFYGMQPTAHIFEPLGRMLIEEGDPEAAVRAWRKGLEINPIAFTEGMRVALAEIYLEKGDAEVLYLLQGYVDLANPDSHLYAVQPFASVAPRWIASLVASRDRAASPTERLISMVEAGGSGSELRAAAEDWRNDMPERLSVSAFCVYLAARAGAPGWREDFAALEERFAAEEGPLKGGWEAVETLFSEEFGER